MVLKEIISQLLTLDGSAVDERVEAFLGTFAQFAIPAVNLGIFSSKDKATRDQQVASYTQALNAVIHGKNSNIRQKQRMATELKGQKKPKIFITGGSGLLGLNWAYQVTNRFEPVLNLHTRTIHPIDMETVSLDLGNEKTLVRELESIGPDLVVHTAGITSIEVCEQDHELADHVNTRIPVNVCKACQSLGIPLIHISTDNLFDGSAAMVAEDHRINPLNYYGLSKARAETGILEIYDNALVIRTNFYGWGPAYKPSFSDTILAALKRQENLSLFEDVYYTPVLISELIAATHELLDGNHRGVFHVVGDERLSKFDFGLRLANAFGLDYRLIRKGRLQEMTNLTKRPLDMSMSNHKVCTLLNRSIGDIDSQISKLKAQEQTTITRAIHEIDSLR